MTEGFVPTSTHYNWKGKVKCIWCNMTGWPCSGCTSLTCWVKFHGNNCSKRER